MGLKAPKLSLILVAAVFALSCFGFTLFVWKTFGGPTPLQAHGYRFHVLFGTEASQLTTNADVRISGVDVGKVVKVSRRGLGADALLEMKAAYAPIPKNSRAIIRFKSLLGESFVELSPGDGTSAKLAENGTLARKNVEPVQQVDRVLGSFDEPTRKAFKLFFQRASKALDKRGSDLNIAIGHLAPTTESAADLLEILDRQRTALRGFVRDTGRALQAVGARESDLQTLVTASNDVFETTASRNRNLQRTVQALPGFLRQTRGALRDIDRVAQTAGPALADLRPVIPLIEPALDELRVLSPELERLFVAVRPTIDAGKTGWPAITRILVPAKPLFDVLDIAGSYLVPLADYVKLYRTDFITWLAKLGSTANYTGGSGQKVARLLNPIDEEALLGYSQRNRSNRHNAYTPPGEIARLADNSVRAFDCRNTDNPQQVPVLGTGTPACRVAPPITFRGLTSQFPHVVPLDQDSPDGGGEEHGETR